MIIDILVIVILLISAMIAFLRGAIREVLTITGVVGGLAAAFYIGPKIAPLFKGWLGVVEGTEPEKLFGILPYDLLGMILAYGAVFITVVIILSILSHFLAETIRNLGLGAVDRTLGFIFGLIRGIILLGLLYLPVHIFAASDSKDEWFAGSKTHLYLEKTAAELEKFIPESAKDDMKESVQQIEKNNETRKKLEDIDLLKRDDRPADDKVQDVPETKGYSEEFRDDVDRLFENINEDANQEPYESERTNP